ncbi:MAG: glycosyltransferase family 2 protein, partial [Dolichospermum sp.]
MLINRYVNIGVVTFNRLEFTKQAIASIVKFTSFPYVISVVDNGSHDGTKDYLLELQEKGIIKNLVLLVENVGVAKASNLAWIQ